MLNVSLPTRKFQLELGLEGLAHMEQVVQSRMQRYRIIWLARHLTMHWPMAMLLKSTGHLQMEK